MPENQPFYVKDCTSAVLATGIKAHTLAEFRDRLQTIHPGCLYFHFWGARLGTVYEYREFHNDFAHWAHHCLHDESLSERLEMIDPTEHEDIEYLRGETIDIIENRLDEGLLLSAIPVEEPFIFKRAKIIVFDTRHVLEKPQDLLRVAPLLTRGSFFYHVIDARRRVPHKRDDFSEWLRSFGKTGEDLIAELGKIDPYFISLGDLKIKLVSLITDYFVRNEMEHKTP